MRATGVDLFDKALQTTSIWLGEIIASQGLGRKVALKVLAVVLHRVRDRIPLELAMQLGAELPLLIRGIYYDQFRPAKTPADSGGVRFKDEVAQWLWDVPPLDSEQAIRTVFAVLSRHLPPDLIRDVQQALPKDTRSLWSAADERVIPMSLRPQRQDPRHQTDTDRVR